MKIAFVYDAIYPYVKGGAEKRYWEIAKKLSKKHEVHLFGMKFWNGENVVERNGIFLHGVCRPYRFYTKTGRRSITGAIYFSLKLLPALISEKFDIIDCSNFPYFSLFSTYFVCKIKNTPLVATWHDVWGDYWYEYLGELGIFGKNVEWISAKLPERIISVSSSVTRGLIENLKIREERINTINNGVDMNLINSVKARKEKNKVIYTGRLVSEKNVDLVIKKIPEYAKLVIIGDGPEKEKLIELSEKLDKNVRFMEFIEDYRNVIKEIKSSCLFISLSEREGFGMSALEAAACGVPVLILKNSFPREVEDLCYTTDIKNAGRKIRRLMMEDGTKDLSKIKEFDWDKIADRIRKFYETIYKPK